jgi:hypothetical protein
MSSENQICGEDTGSHTSEQNMHGNEDQIKNSGAANTSGKISSKTPGHNDRSPLTAETRTSSKSEALTGESGRTPVHALAWNEPAKFHRWLEIRTQK